MKIKLVVASIALGFSGVCSALTQDLGTLDALGSSFSQIFVRNFLGYSSALGNFTDYYTFSLIGPSSAVGTTWSVDFGSLDLSLNSVALRSGTGAGGSLLYSDPTPADFTFGNLGAGSYTLEVNGSLSGSGGGVGAAYYEGTIRSIASAAPEPGTLAMALVGLLGIGGMVWRKRGF